LVVRKSGWILRVAQNGRLQALKPFPGGRVLAVNHHTAFALSVIIRAIRGETPGAGGAAIDGQHGARKGRQQRDTLVS